MKKFEDLTIQDDFLFQKVMLNPDICRELLERILGVAIEKISYHSEAENPVKPAYGSKGIRLDVFVADGKDTIFDIEMQVAHNEEFHLPKRMRYYQSALDTAYLKPGMDYPALAKSYIIFICPFDEIGAGRHVYTFKSLCVEDPGLVLPDEATKIILNTRGAMDDASPKLLSFLDYVNGRDVQGDSLVDKIRAEIELAKRQEGWREEFQMMNMALMDGRMLGRAEGRAEGHTAGLAAGRTEGITASLKNLLKNTAMTAAEAMDALGIPESERPKYAACL